VEVAKPKMLSTAAVLSWALDGMGRKAASAARATGLNIRLLDVGESA
jgi:hypothetical protein